MLPTLLDKSCQVLNRPIAAVSYWVGLVTGEVELDGGEALDLVGDVVGGGVDFGDGDFGGEVLVGGVEGCKFFVLGGETG